MRSLATFRIVFFYVFTELVSLHHAGRSAPLPSTCHHWTLRKVSWPSVSLIRICVSSLFNFPTGMSKVNLESAAHFSSIHISCYWAGFVRADTVSIGSVVKLETGALRACVSVWVRFKHLDLPVKVTARGGFSGVRVRVKHLNGTQRTVIIETSMNHTWSSRQVKSGSSIYPHTMTEKKQLQSESWAHKFKNQKTTNHC